jgi:protein involved in polysaccharide export with SLBB domain
MMKNEQVLLFLVAILALMFFMGEVEAQVSTSSMLSSTTVQHSTSNYFFAKPNELTITVDVIGMVQRPGRYEISNNINLVNLMALAGGGNLDAAMDDVRITRLLETEGRIRLRVLHFDLEDLSKVDPSELTLQPGDVIQIEKSGWASFRDAFSVVVGTAIITGAVAQVIYASKR